MKKLIFTISTFLLVTTNSSALDFTPFSDFTRVIKDEIHLTTVAVTPLSVRCSMIGYGLSELKLNIPSLRWHAVLDHSNGENLGSCVTAGPKFCEFGNMPKIPDGFFVNDTPNVETEMRVILNEQFVTNEDGSCERTLVENISLDVRGIKFTHQKSKRIGLINEAECRELF